MSHNANVEAAANVLAREALHNHQDTFRAFALALEAEGLLAVPERPRLGEKARGRLVFRRRPAAAKPAAAQAGEASSTGTVGVIACSRGLIVTAGPADTQPVPVVEQTQALPAVPAPAVSPELTELEREAEAWDRRCRPARSLAARMAVDYGARREIHTIRPDGDKVDVVLAQTAGLADWQTWLAAVHAVPESLRPLKDGLCGITGSYNGIAVRVFGPGVPEVVAEAARACREVARAKGAPTRYVYEGVVYDLTVSLTDRDGDVWRHYGEFTPLGMPLLAQEADEDHSRCTLANILRYVGPLIPAEPGPVHEHADQAPAFEETRSLVRAGAMTAIEVAEYLRTQPCVEQAAVVDDMAVSVELRPADLLDWWAWVERLSVPPASARPCGESVTARGSYRGVAVTVVGHGVPGLQAAVPLAEALGGETA